MSQWSHNNPDLVGTDADPWMMHESYRDASRYVKSLSPETYCRDCGNFLEHGERGLCEDCKR